MKNRKNDETQDNGLEITLIHRNKILMVMHREDIKDKLIMN